MEKTDVNCVHACRNTCAMLNEALRKEASLVRFYEGVLDECNFPEVRSFLLETVDMKRQGILAIIKKLNELHANSQTMNGVASSFNDGSVW